MKVFQNTGMKQKLAYRVSSDHRFSYNFHIMLRLPENNNQSIFDKAKRID